MAAPALAAILALFLFGHLSLTAASIGLVVAGAFALMGAVEHARERLAVGRWLDALAHDAEQRPLPFIRNPLIEIVGQAVTQMRREVRIDLCRPALIGILDDLGGRSTGTHR
ncbi:MAG: hypothetical protein AAFY56_21680, partial [Pseudomonadota bacterium]